MYCKTIFLLLITLKDCFHYFTYTSDQGIMNLCHYRYVCVGSSLPELALTAVRVLYWVTQSHKAGRDVVTTIISDKV